MTLSLTQHLFMLGFTLAFMVVTLGGLGIAMARLHRELP